MTPNPFPLAQENRPGLSKPAPAHSPRRGPRNILCHWPSWLGLLALVMVLGCQQTVTYTTTAGGVQIVAKLDQQGQFSSVTQNGDSTTVITLMSGKTIVIETSRILVDKTEKIKLPENVQRIEVRVQRGKIEVALDNQAFAPLE